MKKILKSSQFALFILVIAIIVLFSIINPDIMTKASLYSLARTCTVPATFALAIMIVMVIGELDMSFCMIGAFSAYTTMFVLTTNGLMGTNIVFIFLFSIIIAVILQLCNWVLIDRMKLQSFIATLGMQSFLKGTILAFVSSSYIYTLPAAANALGTTYLGTASYSSGVSSQLPAAVLFTLALYVLMYIVLEHTNFGRQLYSLGGDAEASSRAGMDVSKIRFIAFVLVGIICGMGGVLHNCLGRCSLPMPTDLVGTELNGIAAVVLGRGAQQRAKGVVVGTLLGVVLLQFISNNLIMIGIPTFYQNFVTGIIVFLGLVFQMRKKGSLFRLFKKEEKA